MHFSNCDVLEWFYDFALLSIVLSLKKTSSIWASRACNLGQFQKRSFTFGYWPLVTLTHSLVVVGRHRRARHTFVWVQPVAWQPPILKITNGQTPFNSSPPTVWINLGASPTGWRPFAFTSISVKGKYIHIYTHKKQRTNKSPNTHTHTKTTFKFGKTRWHFTHLFVVCHPNLRINFLSIFFLAEKSSHGYFTWWVGYVGHVLVFVCVSMFLNTEGKSMGTKACNGFGRCKSLKSWVSSGFSPQFTLTSRITVSGWWWLLFFFTQGDT